MAKCQTRMSLVLYMCSFNDPGNIGNEVASCLGIDYRTFSISDDSVIWLLCVCASIATPQTTYRIRVLDPIN